MVKVRGRRSKLAKSRQKREKTTLRQITLVSTLTLILVIFLVFWGLQGLVNLASFLGTIRGADQQIEQSKQLPLLAPRLVPLPTATNSAKILISGVAESGSIVEIFSNDVSVGTTLVRQDNKFQISDVALASGENKIYAIAQKNKKESPPSRTIYIHLKETPPKLKITNPSDQAIFSGKEDKVEVRGETDPEVNVAVNNHWAIVAPSGSFSFKLQLLESKNPIEIVATDTAGNQTTINLSVTYVP
jgi:hypothetical protein